MIKRNSEKFKESLQRGRERDWSSRRRNNRRLLKILDLFDLSRYLGSLGIFLVVCLFLFPSSSSLSSLFSSSSIFEFLSYFFICFLAISRGPLVDRTFRCWTRR